MKPARGKPRVYVGARGQRRHVAGIALCVLIIIGAMGAAVTSGSGDIDLAGVLRALTGTGDAGDVFIVQQWRVPRVIAAACFGAALAVSGALFQAVTRNPLGSPDIVGFDTGAFSGALLAGIVAAGAFPAVAAGSVVAGIVTAIVVHVITSSLGGGTVRLIIVGIATGAFLTSVNAWIVLASDVKVAMSASNWALGSLGEVSWSRLVPASMILAALAVVVALLTPQVRMLGLGDELAGGLGVGVERTRLLATLVAVSLSSTVVAVTGPIAFVALAAPHAARLLTGNRQFDPLGAALLGGGLLLVCDALSHAVIPGSPLPVGAVTVCVGGCYLIALIALGRPDRRQS